jgi:hypothetical protein
VKQIAVSILGSGELIDRSVGPSTTAGDLFCNVSLPDKSGEATAKAPQTISEASKSSLSVCAIPAAKWFPEPNITRKTGFRNS